LFRPSGKFPEHRHSLLFTSNCAPDLRTNSKRKRLERRVATAIRGLFTAQLNGGPGLKPVI
jgi:hypothetical protein